MRSTQFSGRQNVAVALCAIAIGLYVMLAAGGFAPIPNARNSINGPVWVALVSGGAFVLAGLIVLSRGMAGDGCFAGPLPEDAPYWLRLGQYLAVLSLFVTFAAIGSWVAMGPGTRTFNMSVPWFVSDEAGERFGRFAFAVGALITWACAIAIGVTGARKLFGKQTVKT